MANFGNDFAGINPNPTLIPGIITNPGFDSPNLGTIKPITSIFNPTPGIIQPITTIFNPTPGIIQPINPGIIAGPTPGRDVRHIPPIFTSSDNSSLISGGYSAQVKEGSPNGYLLVTAKAISFVTAPAWVPLALTSGDTRIFAFDGSNGQLTVISSDRLKAGDSHELKIQANDGNKTTNSTIKVVVFSTPVFTYPDDKSSPVSVPEDEPLNSPFMTLTADGKSGDPNLRFTIISQEPSTQFIVDNSGGVKITTRLDYETITQYKLKFRVTNSGGAFIDSVPVIVNVTNVNDISPVFEKQLYTTKVFLSAEQGDVILTVKGTDADAGATILKYSIVSGNEANNFRLEELSGELKVAPAKLDTNAGLDYTLKIEVSDGSLFGSADCRIKIIRPPIFTKPDLTWSPLSVFENIAIGSQVRQLEAESRNGDKTFVFSIDSQEPLVPFTVDNLGRVLTNGELDYEKIKQYVLKFRVSDSTNQSSESIPVIINVTNVNDKIPVFDKPIYTATMLEGAQKGLPVLTARASDADDVKTVLTYSIITGDEAGNFTLDKFTGELTVAASKLDYGNGQYSLEIQVSDGELKGSAECKINVNAPPTFILQSGSSNAESVEENALPQIILQAKAESKMGDTNLVYSIASQELAQPAFTVDQKTGELKTVAPIDLERGVQKYVLKLRVTDSLGLSSDSAPVTVSVIDVNDNKPTFSQDLYTKTVLETTTSGTRILVVTGVDMDVDATLTYSIIAGNDSKHFTMINVAKTGWLLLTASKLDYKIAKLHTMTVQVSDGKFTAEAKVEITVIPSDGIVPIFLRPDRDSSTKDIEEGLLPKTVVYQVEGLGVTPSDTLLFTIASQQPAIPAFTLSSKGVLMTPLLPILADAVPAFEFVFRVSDTKASSESIPFKVSVKQNNNAPKFDFPEYSAQIRRGIRRGIVVLNVVALNTSGTTLVYSITGGNQQETFVLRSDGTLRVDIPNNIDSRVTSLYTIVVQASDSRYVGYTTCKIYVAPNPETHKTQISENSKFWECWPFNKMWENLLYTKWF